MIESVYSKYFQKSRSFLFPALGIKKDSPFNPSGTYIAFEHIITADDMILICAYKVEDTPEFREFEEVNLLNNPLFKTVVKLNDYNFYMFNMESYKSDWFNFIMGKYSKFTTILKKAIRSYYGQNTTEYLYMDSYLNPEKHYSKYAELLDVTVSTLKETGELCDPCDLAKETLKIPKQDLDVLEKSLPL